MFDHFPLHPQMLQLFLVCGSDVYICPEWRGVSANSPQRYVLYKLERKRRFRTWSVLFPSSSLSLDHSVPNPPTPNLARLESAPLSPSSHQRYPTPAQSGPDWLRPPGPQKGGTGHTSHSGYGRSEHCKRERRKEMWCWVLTLLLKMCVQM